MRNIIMFAILALGLVLTSCNKEDIQLTQTETENIDDLFQHSKDLAITDQEGTSIVMRIHSDDASLLEKYTARNISIIPVLEHQTGTEALQAANLLQAATEEADETLANTLGEQKANIAFEVVAKTLAKGVKSYLVRFQHPETANRAWNYNWYYSQTNVDETAYVVRHSTFDRVYYGLDYKATSSSSYSTIVSQWYKLQKNVPRSHTRSNCYKLRMSVAHRDVTDYTVMFF